MHFELDLTNQVWLNIQSRYRFVGKSIICCLRYQEEHFLNVLGIFVFRSDEEGTTMLFQTKALLLGPACKSVVKVIDAQPRGCQFDPRKGLPAHS